MAEGPSGHVGYGKLILFGEHFVVYRVPALVAAVNDYTDCKVKFVPGGSGFTVIDDRPAVPGYKVEKKEEADGAIELVLKHMGVDYASQGVEMTFGGNLTCASGIGASAAQCVSLARALAELQGKSFTEEEVNRAGYEGEKGYHGTPSGIDNTAATYGGVLRFQRTEGDPIFTKHPVKSRVEIVYASTGITSSTTKVVGDVRSKKEADEGWFEGLLSQYKAVMLQGAAALEAGEWGALGAALDANHALCQQLTVSCKELDDLVAAAKAAGAVGAKMSGTGRGGLMLALAPGEEAQEKVAAALRAAGAPQVWKTTIG